MVNLIRIEISRCCLSNTSPVTGGVRTKFTFNWDEVIRIWLQKLRTSKYFKELIFNTILFADDQFVISDTEDNL